jgi:hypothetical protein
MRRMHLTAKPVCFRLAISHGHSNSRLLGCSTWVLVRNYQGVWLLNLAQLALLNSLGRWDLRCSGTRYHGSSLAASSGSPLSHSEPMPELDRKDFPLVHCARRPLLCPAHLQTAGVP